jgi:hypothetical protein
MCKTCGKFVYNLRKAAGKPYYGLVEKIKTCALVCKTTTLYTFLYQLFSQAILSPQHRQIPEFSPLSTTLTVTTNLNKGVI